MDAKTGIGFLQIAPADNDKGYDSALGRNILGSAKRERLESSYLKLGIFSLGSKIVMSRA